MGGLIQSLRRQVGEYHRQLVAFRPQLPPWPWTKQREVSETAHLLESLPEVMRPLEEFARLSDREFTDLLQSLAQLQTIVGPLRERTEAIIRLLEEKDEEKAVFSAHRTFRNCIDLIHSSLGVATSQQERMKEVVAALAEAVKWKEEFRRNSLYLRIVEMGMRVETARISSEYREVFSTVASAIEEIVQRMEYCVDNAFARIDRVMALARQEREEQDALAAALEKRSTASIQSIDADLNNLRQRFPLHLEVCAVILRDFARLESTFGQLLYATQHQDIVRQKVEHVCAGLTEMRTADGSGREAFLRASARVQSGQLESARSDIEKAGQALTTHCRELMPLAGEMVTQFQLLQEGVQETLSSSQSTCGFLQEVEQLSTVTRQTEISNARFEKLIGEISRTLQDFRREICELEIEVKRVAINAQLASVRLESVDALNKLAEEATTVAVRNNETTRQLLSAMEEALQAMEKMRSQSLEFMEIVNREKSDLLLGATESQGKLDRLYSFLRAATGQTRETFQSVQARFQQLLENLTFPGKIPEVFAPPITLCRQIESLVPADPNGREAGLLDAHLARYTMKSENAVHARALATGGGVLAGSAAVASGWLDDTPDAGTELFTDLPSDGVLLPGQETSADLAGPSGAAPATRSGTPSAEAAATEDDGIELF